MEPVPVAPSSLSACFSFSCVRNPAFQSWFNAGDTSLASLGPEGSPTRQALIIDLLNFLRDEASPFLNPRSATTASTPLPAPPPPPVAAAAMLSPPKAKLPPPPPTEDEFPPLGGSTTLSSTSATAPPAPPRPRRKIAPQPITLSCYLTTTASSHKTVNKVNSTTTTAAAINKENFQHSEKMTTTSTTTTTTPSPPPQPPKKAKRRIRTLLVDQAPSYGDITRVPSSSDLGGFGSSNGSSGNLVVGNEGDMIDSRMRTPSKALTIKAQAMMMGGASPSPFKGSTVASKTPTQTPIKGASPRVALFNSPPPKPLPSPPLDRPRLKDLGVLYGSLLHQGHGVTKISSELDLLLRLLTTHESLTLPPDSTNILLNSGLACQVFACWALQACKSLVLSLGAPVLRLLRNQPGLTRESPELVAEMEELLAVEGTRALGGKGDQGGGGMTPLLAMGREGNQESESLPVAFCEERDARHLYQGSDWEKDVFKRREETKDVFLNLLRDFQKERTRLDDQGIGTFLSSLQHRIHQLLSWLAAANTPWFANFFEATLVQVGLSGLQEHDQDLLEALQGAGSSPGRLRKLKGRLESTTPSSTRTRHRVLEDSTPTVTAPPTPHQQSQPPSSAPPQQAQPTLNPESLFHGLEEFFYRFIVLADSQHFSSCLRQRLAQQLSQASRVIDHDDVVDHMRRMRLRAKFLGLLLFSPNWVTREDDMRLSSLPPHHPLQVALQEQITAANLLNPSFPFIHHLHLAQHSHHLVMSLPWLLDVVRMVQWDPVSRATRYYHRVFVELRRLHGWLRQRIFEQQPLPQQGEAEVTEETAKSLSEEQDPSPSTTTMCPGNAVFLLLEIEQVLDELDQLGKGGKEDDDNEENNGFNGGRGRCSMMMMALGQGGSCVGTKDGKGGGPCPSIPLDSQALPLTPRFIQSCSRPLSLVCHFLASSTNNNPFLTSGPIKKVRPYTITTEPAAAASSTPQPSSVTTRPTPLTAQSSFFQQHPHLQRLAETVVSSSLQNACALTLTTIVDPITSAAIMEATTDPLIPQLRDPSLTHALIDDTQSRAKDQASIFLLHFYRTHIPRSLRLLTLPSFLPEVVNMACQLAVKRAISDGVDMVLAEVDRAVKRSIDNYRTTYLKSSRQAAIAPPLAPHHSTTTITTTSVMIAIEALTKATAYASTDVDMAAALASLRPLTREVVHNLSAVDLDGLMEASTRLVLSGLTQWGDVWEKGRGVMASLLDLWAWVGEDRVVGDSSGKREKGGGGGYLRGYVQGWVWSWRVMKAAVAVLGEEGMVEGWVKLWVTGMAQVDELEQGMMEALGEEGDNLSWVKALAKRMRDHPRCYDHQLSRLWAMCGVLERKGRP